MAKPTAWMPMFWGDYLRDTQHLSTEEHGAYLLLIAHYWSTGRPLPDDPKYLMRLTTLSEYKAKKIFPVLSAFFKIENGHWHHARIERELTGAFGRSEHARRGAMGRWHPPSSDGANHARAKNGQASGNAHHNHLMNNHDSESLTDAARDPALNGGSGPRASRPETLQERLLRMAEAHREKTLRGEK